MRDEPLPLPPEMEMANLEHRLAFWKQQEANLKKTWRTFCYLGPPTLILCLVIPVIGTIWTGGDLLVTVFLMAMVIVFIAFTGVLSYFFTGLGFKLTRYVNYGVFVEEAIAECEKRLAELRAQR